MAKKNQKYRKQSRSKNVPWLFLALGGGLLLMAAFLFTSQSSSDGTPSISVDQRQIDYGDVKFNETRSFKIAVSNTGDGTLRFEEEPYIEVVEGC